MTTSKTDSTFDPLNDPRADIILRSSDKTIFKVRRIHLQSGSRFFDDMLSSPELGTIGEKVDGLAVVDMAESGGDLKVFLSVLLPGPSMGDQLVVGNTAMSVQRTRFASTVFHS